jgi:uncharacterized membrane protein
MEVTESTWSLSTLHIISVIAFTIYLGLISGIIPSPLYQNQKQKQWSSEYAILQLAFVVLTAARLTSQGTSAESLDMVMVGGDEESEYDFDL